MISIRKAGTDSRKRGLYGILIKRTQGRPKEGKKKGSDSMIISRKDDDDSGRGTGESASGIPGWSAEKPTEKGETGQDGMGV